MYYNARWYDPALGRFAQADSIIPPGVQGLDRYAYVNNSPMNYVDPSGHFTCSNDTNSDDYCPGRLPSSIGISGDGGKGKGGKGGREMGDDFQGGIGSGSTPIPSINDILPSPQTMCGFVIESYICNMDYSASVDPQNPYSIPSMIEVIPNLRYDFSRVNTDDLAFDIVGLGLSIFGLKSVQGSVARMGFRKDGISFAVDITSATHTGISVQRNLQNNKVDTVSLAANVIGSAPYPPVAIGVSSFSILYDLSEGIYDVRDYPQPMPGLPTGPWCDRKYGC